MQLQIPEVTLRRCLLSLPLHSKTLEKNPLFGAISSLVPTGSPILDVNNLIVFVKIPVRISYDYFYIVQSRVIVKPQHVVV
jgi:hypothetical protein